MARRTSLRVRVLFAALAAALLVLGGSAALIRAGVADRAETKAVLTAQSQASTIVTLLQESLADHAGWGVAAIQDVIGVDVSWAVSTLGDRPTSAVGLWQSYVEAGQPLPVVTSASLVTFRFGDQCGPGQCVLSGRELRAAVALVAGDALIPTLVVYVLVRPFAVDEALADLDPLLLTGVVGGLVLVGLLTWWVVRRVLRPVEKLRRELVEITATDLGRRVPVPKTGDELERWAVTTNETLDRLEAAVNQQRSFVDDAAHELRTPLASLLSTLEVAVAHPGRIDPRAAVGVALAEAQRLQRLTDDLLLLARLDRAVPSGAALVDLGALVAEQVAERQFASAPAIRFTLTTMDGGLRVLGDESRLGRVLRNLLDNAAVYAASSVEVSLRRAGGQAELEVLDDGPGIPVGDRERVFQRFTRLDGARRADGGAGLGLAIARDIVVQYGGRIRVEDSDLGARLVVHLPLVTEPGSGEVRTRDGAVSTRASGVRRRSDGESRVVEDARLSAPRGLR